MRKEKKKKRHLNYILPPSDKGNLTYLLSQSLRTESSPPPPGGQSMVSTSFWCTVVLSASPRTSGDIANTSTAKEAVQSGADRHHAEPKGPTSVSSGHQDDSTFFETLRPLAPWVGGGALQRPKQAGVMPFTQLEVGGTVGLLVDRCEFSQRHRKSVL